MNVFAYREINNMAKSLTLYTFVIIYTVILPRPTLVLFKTLNNVISSAGCVNDSKGFFFVFFATPVRLVYVNDLCHD